ncbi:conserved hypothetical protein [Frankia canadensis]|uniref:Uncharacterized protein n=1 Tax=Frankia canadensis TaxID=1836972 RepID=A0A2I2KWB0_9ACTN|nr:hypothetical protein [Frankia canadensis]SNQ49936.1 conserved hypothetical protein [Frankia canadensis]SOU57226.1 conserved hypothetical protein [Frankia canadensis]
MPSAGLAWQTLTDPGALALVDADSGRAAALSRPHPADLPMVQIVDLERLVSGWLAPATRPQSAQRLREQEAADPLRTLRGLCWLAAMWVVALHLRTGWQPTAIVGDLNVPGIWRLAEAPCSAQVWEDLAERVRLGVLAALTGDADANARFADYLRRPPGIAPILLNHTLRILEDLHQRMLENGIDSRDMAGTLALYTVDPADRATACFRPLT